MTENQGNPYDTPKADLGNGTSSRRYAGFWIRTLAAILDTIIILLITGPLLYVIYGAEMFTSEDMVQGSADVLLSYVFPLVFTVVLWMKFGGTPAKRLLKIKVLDEKTGKHLTLGKSLLRYVGYFVAMIPLLIGIIWVAFDKKKKGWHDHIAGTIVVIE